MIAETRGGASVGLIGREPETERIDLILDRLQFGGGALLLQGEAGIGKSSLLEYAAARAVALSAQVLRTTGVESEAELAFAGLHQLLDPLLGSLSELPAPQCGALQVAFGIDDDTAPDPFLVALAAHELTRLAAARSPVMIVVDDVQWLDSASAQVVTFVARRLGGGGVSILAASRSGWSTSLEQAAVPMLELGRLGSGESALLLDRDAPALHPVARARVLAESEGNPLALVELARSSAASAGSTHQLLDVPPTLTVRLERAFAGRLGELPAATTLCLIAAALDARATTGEVIAAASSVLESPVEITALDPAVEGQFIDVAEHGIRFRHPLVRSAVRQAALPGEVSTMYAALAAAVSHPERRIWHRAMSTSGPDAQIARALDEHAIAARRRGAIAVAAAALERAASLTADAQLKGDRLVRAAELAYELGLIGAVRRLLAETEGLQIHALAAARALWLEQMLSGEIWVAPHVIRTFVEISQQIRDGGDAEMALRSLQPIAHRLWWTRARPETRRYLVETARASGMPAADPRLMAVVALADPEGAGESTRRQLALVRRHELDDPADAVHLGIAAEKAGDFVAGSALLARGIDGLREQGRLGMLTQALVHYAWAAVHVGNWSATAASSREAIGLARDTGQPEYGLTAAMQEALAAALRGSESEMDAMLEGPEQQLRAMRSFPLLATAHLARGAAALGDGRHADAFRSLWPVFDEAAPEFQRFFRWPAILDLVEAGVGCGESERVRAVVASLEQTAGGCRPPILEVGLFCARPLLADLHAEELFVEALAEDLGDFPFYRARTLFSYGRWLRRRRRTIESRARLREAVVVFEALGAARWSQRARQELRAAGEATGGSPDALRLLTAQELEIAKLAAAGLSNRQIGERLFLSHRTIGSHLYRIFPKLEVTARAQLRDAITRLDDGRGPPAAAPVLQHKRAKLTGSDGRST